MGQEIQYDGKVWQVYSTVVDDFVSEPLKSPQEVGEWYDKNCSGRNSAEVPVAYARDLKCKCSGENYGREQNGELWFECGLSRSLLYKGMGPKSISDEEIRRRVEGEGGKVISRTSYCELEKQKAVVAAMEAKLKYDMLGYWRSCL